MDIQCVISRIWTTVISFCIGSFYPAMQLCGQGFHFQYCSFPTPVFLVAASKLLRIFWHINSLQEWKCLMLRLCEHAQNQAIYCSLLQRKKNRGWKIATKNCHLRGVSVCKMTQKEEHLLDTQKLNLVRQLFPHLIMIDGVTTRAGKQRRKAAFSLLNNTEKQAFSLGKHSSLVHLYSRCQLYTVRKQDQSSKAA